MNEVSLRQQAAKEGITHFATGIAVFDNGKLLVVRRNANEDFLAGVWELPGGGVDDGETIEEGAKRELKEETNLDVASFLTSFKGFDYSTPTKPKVRQVNFIVNTKQGEIKLTEHDRYEWIAEEDIKHLKSTPNMKHCLKQAFMAFNLLSY